VEVWGLGRHELFALLTGLIPTQSFVFGGQYAVELLDKFEKFVPIFFCGDKGAEFVNAFAIGFVH
jgi:hypothetical protein